MGKIIAGKISDIPPGKMIKVSIDGRDVLVANIDGEYCATDDSCTHSGSSLSEGNWMDVQSHVVGMEHNLIVKLEN